MCHTPNVSVCTNNTPPTFLVYKKRNVWCTSFVHFYKIKKKNKKKNKSTIKYVRPRTYWSCILNDGMVNLLKKKERQ
jgi:hypothetical protein